MPDFGLTKAIAEAASESAAKARVMRPAEAELAARAAAKAKGAAPAVEPTMQPIAPPVVQDLPSAAQDAAGQPIDHTATAPTTQPTAMPMETQAPPQVAPNQVIDDTQGIPPQAPPSGVGEIPPVNPNNAAPAAAVRLSQATLGDHALDASHMPNFDMITTTDDIKATIAELAEQNKGKVDEARRGTITNDQLQGLANDLDMSTDVVQRVMQRETGGVLNGETILAARQVVNGSADRLRTLAVKITAGQATDIEKVQFARQMQFHNEFYKQFMGARAEAGRSLNAFSIPTGTDNFVAGRVNEILQATGMDLGRAARAINMANSVAGISDIVKGTLMARLGRTARSFVNRLFVNGILSGIKTHLVNSSGNAIMQLMTTAETAVAARIGRFLPGDEHVQAGEAMAMLHGTYSATGDAFRLFGQALKTGQTLDGILKYDSPSARQGTLAAFPSLDKGILGSIVKVFDTVTDLPTRALGAEDELFKTLAYRADLQRQMFLHIMDQAKAGKVTAENAAQVARDFMENPSEEAQQAAEDYANQVTFQTPLGTAGQAVQAMVRKVPGLELIAPFIRTPANIFKESVGARTPLALFTARFWSAMSEGGRARDLALARFSMATATAGAVAWEVMQGNITGNGPLEPKARGLWLENGRRPYSWKFENPVTGEMTYHDYSRMEPFASVVGAVADTIEIGSYISSDPEAPQQDDGSPAYLAAASIVAGIMNNTGNKAFLKGASDFFAFTNDPGRTIGSYIPQMATALTPFSALSRNLRNIQDPYLREAWTLTDKLKDNTPGYSVGLPLRMDLFGQPREKASGTLLGAMSPIPESPEKYDDVVKEATSLMDATHQVPLTMPEKRVEGMRLNAQEYAHLVEVSRGAPIFSGGRDFHDELQRVMDSPVYQKAPPLYRVGLLQDVQRRADSIGRELLEKPGPYQDQDYVNRITDWRMQVNRLKYDK